MVMKISYNQFIYHHNLAVNPVFDIHNLPAQHRKVEMELSLEKLSASDWQLFGSASEQKCLGYREIRSGPNKYDYLHRLTMADLLRRCIEEESLAIQVASSCLVFLDSPGQQPKWAVLQKKAPPSHCEAMIQSLSALPYQQQLLLANDLCCLIMTTGFMHARIESMGIEGGKLVIYNTSPCGLLRDVSDENPNYSPRVDECAQIGLDMMLRSFGRHNPVFRLAAIKALSMQKDIGVDDNPQALRLAKFTFESLHSSYGEKLTAFNVLHPRLKEFFQFLVWASLGRPDQKRFGEAFIQSHPEILVEIKNLEGKSLIQQVYEQMELRCQLLSAQQLLIRLKVEWSSSCVKFCEIKMIFESLFQKTLKESVFQPLMSKISQALKKDLRKYQQQPLTLEEVKQICQTLLEIPTPDSSSCLIDELIFALQTARETLSINSYKHRIREGVSRNLQLAKLGAPQRELIDAKRFDMSIPKEIILQRLKIALIAYECAKFGVKFGGLGEAAYGLAKGLTEVGHTVMIILPKFDLIPLDIVSHLQKQIDPIVHSYKGQSKTDAFYTHAIEGIRLCYLEDSNPIDGKDHYELGTSGNIYKDGILADSREEWYGLKERMLYFSSASAALIKAHRAMLDLFIVNDWHGADSFRHLESENIPGVFIIHNNNYGAQGVFDRVSAEIPGFFGNSSSGLNIMLEAIARADQVVTVSKTFALEMQTKALGSGIDLWMREITVQGKLSGIINGSNPDLWNPATNQALKQWKELARGPNQSVLVTGSLVDLSFDATDPSILVKKQKIKAQLQLAIEKYYSEAFQKFELNLISREILLYVGRYDSSQKGLDKLLPAIKVAHRNNATVIIMGVGEDPEATKILDEIQSYAEVHKGVWLTRGDRNNTSLKMQMGSGDIPALGPLIRAAATFGIMPSSFEPCGLVQYELWLYGVPVIASKTGGLADTVNTDKDSSDFNGFLFERLPEWDSVKQSELVMDAVEEAFRFWAPIAEDRKRCMMQQFMQDAKSASWTSAPRGLTPVDQFDRVFAAARRHVLFRNSRLLDITPSLKLSFINLKADGYFGQGMQHSLYNDFGAHFIKEGGQTMGVRFQTLAPNALSVSVVIKTKDGEESIPMHKSAQDGVWVLFQPGLKKDTVYEYAINTAQGQLLRKADPFAFGSELRPEHGSIVRDPDAYLWNDQQWIAERPQRFKGKYPLNIYEVHLSSWKKTEAGDFCNYRELAPLLARYCRKMHFTHLELLGLFEYPNDASWGYQMSGYFCPTSRHGNIEDLQYFVDEMHRAEIAVIVDWAPFHFATDNWSLGQFDGSPLFEDTDHFNGIAPDEWGSLVFDMAKQDVRNFLISSAHFSFDKLHIDGIRFDAVTHLVDLSWGRKIFTPSYDGTKVHHEGIHMLKEFNQSVHRRFPGVITCAENWAEAPDTTPIEGGGYGFDRRWSSRGNSFQKILDQEDNGRKQAYSALKDAILALPLSREIVSISHDEVTPFKKSLFDKSLGPESKRFANARLYLTTQAFMQGDGILTFMGTEFAQKKAWNCQTELDFKDLNEPLHKQMRKLTKKINKLYNSSSAFWSSSQQFEWVDRFSAENVVFSYHRKDALGHQFLIVHNYSTTAFLEYRLAFKEGKPTNKLKKITEVLNTDEWKFGGSGKYINGEGARILRKAEEVEGLIIKLAPLATVVLEEEFEQL
jgi:1,4-alpha-glucan branching enzyme